MASRTDDDLHETDEKSTVRNRLKRMPIYNCIPNLCLVKLSMKIKLSIKMQFSEPYKHNEINDEACQLPEQKTVIFTQKGKEKNQALQLTYNIPQFE